MSILIIVLLLNVDLMLIDSRVKHFLEVIYLVT